MTSDGLTSSGFDWGSFLNSAVGSVAHGFGQGVGSSQKSTPTGVTQSGGSNGTGSEFDVSGWTVATSSSKAKGAAGKLNWYWIAAGVIGIYILAKPKK